MAKQMPVIQSKLRHIVKVPECIYDVSGINVNGKRIKSLVFSTDVAVIANCNADAVIAVFGNVFGTATSRYGSGTEEEIEKMIQQYDIVNDLGIKCVHYQLALNVLAKIAIVSLVCFWR